MEGRSASGRLVAIAVALSALTFRCTALFDPSDFSSGEQPTPEAGAPETGASDGTAPEGGLPEGGLPDGAVVWQGNGHAYLVVAKGRNLLWEVAKEEAVAMGGHLATISSAAENDFVFQLALQNGRAWDGSWGGPYLGGFRTSQTPAGEEWAWVTGEPWSYTAWASGEPTAHENEMYLQINDKELGLWNNVDTGSSNSFVVEFE